MVGLKTKSWVSFKDYSKSGPVKTLCGSGKQESKRKIIKSIRDLLN